MASSELQAAWLRSLITGETPAIRTIIHGRRGTVMVLGHSPTCSKGLSTEAVCLVTRSKLPAIVWACGSDDATAPVVAEYATWALRLKCGRGEPRGRRRSDVGFVDAKNRPFLTAACVADVWVTPYTTDAHNRWHGWERLRRCIIRQPRQALLVDVGIWAYRPFRRTCLSVDGMSRHEDECNGEEHGSHSKRHDGQQYLQACITFRDTDNTWSLNTVAELSVLISGS